MAYTISTSVAGATEFDRRWLSLSATFSRKRDAIAAAAAKSIKDPDICVSVHRSWACRVGRQITGTAHRCIWAAVDGRKYADDAGIDLHSPSEVSA